MFGSQTDPTDDKETIMVVDDTPANLKLLNNMLTNEGYRVLTCPNGVTALKIATNNYPPDLILLDIIMPEIDGFEVCKQLKSIESLKEIPVIFISALTETTEKISAFNSGGVDYVTKPFHFEEVLARVKAHLEIVKQKRQLRQAYNRLQELEQMRDSLVHMIVHDMRSPIMSIRGNLELTLDELLPPSANIFINSALDSTLKIDNMIATLLDVSKMEDGKMVLKQSNIDIISLIKEAIKMVEPRKKGRQITVKSLNETALLPPILADAGLIQRVLQNLIDNAIKFTNKDSGKITISVEVVGDEDLYVFVEDNGKGIPLEYQSRVFDKFFQVQSAKKASIHSSGLGMTFCKLAVEAHEGKIGLNSEMGKGAIFWFTLPIHKKK
ncbi:MAG: hybrid sensor histidine kinase/response regulator [Desulfamplus sp.]|nr:hybrid sensor histidine kinase/response regulator [Desulfamplus sp.]MBF0388544.1 hybrid sensor histidine kinase/response regulator [Desulfamplus sp.]